VLNAASADAGTVPGQRFSVHRGHRHAGSGGWPDPGTCHSLRVMPGDHHVPWTLAGEKETLVDFLDYLRGAVIRKAAGLPAATVRRPMVGSGTSLLGLVKHLTRVEDRLVSICVRRCGRAGPRRRSGR